MQWFRPKAVFLIVLLWHWEKQMKPQFLLSWELAQQRVHVVCVLLSCFACVSRVHKLNEGMPQQLFAMLLSEKLITFGRHSCVDEQIFHFVCSQQTCFITRHVLNGGLPWVVRDPAKPRCRFESLCQPRSSSAALVPGTNNMFNFGGVCAAPLEICTLSPLWWGTKGPNWKPQSLSPLLQQDVASF